MVEQPQRGILLVDLVAADVPGTHVVAIREMIAAGGVRVNGEDCTANRRLRVGDVVEIRSTALLRRHARKAPPAGPSAASGAAARASVCFESATALVLEKPAGVASVPERSGAGDSVHAWLPALRPGEDLRIVHRLDRDTSGCLLLAKGLAAARHFDVQFREGHVRKTYVALVHGVPGQAEFAIDAWLGPDPKRPGKVVAADRAQRGFREAHTVVLVREAFAQFALLELRPTTGRGHQLRVHLQSVGHAIVGDAAYGGQPLRLSQIKPGYKRRSGVTEQPLLARMFLHAERLEFADVDGNPVAATAPLPQDLALAMKQLHQFDAPRRRSCD